MINLKEIFNEETFIISDHHFEHSNVEEFEPTRKQRREQLNFGSFEDMLVFNHNKVVKENDNVIFLGDFSWKSPTRWLEKLNGNKYLILGNHDKPNHESYYKIFKHVFKGINIDIGGTTYTSNFEDQLISAVILNINNEKIVFCHYPVGFVDKHDIRNEKLEKRLKTLSTEIFKLNPSRCIHGHVHSNTINDTFYKNVSCENIDFTPTKLKDLL